jgi:hypothetical protein
MSGPLLLPIDRVRAEQFMLLGTVRSARHLFQDYKVWIDAEGVAWAGKCSGSHGFAVTWLGAGWVFDLHARRRRADRLAELHDKMKRARSDRHRRELDRVAKLLRLGRPAERLLWAIHQRVWEARKSVLLVPDHLLARAVWGRQDRDRPAHWRQDLLHLLEGLSWLHLTDWPTDAQPRLGQGTALLTHVADLRGTDADTCGENCPGHLGPRHHHFLINVGRGFLGVLEQFADADEANGRTYTFPRGGPKSTGPSLWRVGKSGRLVSIFLPAQLGEPAACSALTARQHRLLQALVRETTRATKKRRRDIAEAEVFAGNQVVAFHGKKLRTCPLLNSTGQHVGFNGNGMLKGHGYRLASEGGWLAKAGYPLTEVGAFVDDLALLAGLLGLTVVGVDRDSRFVTLGEMQTLAVTTAGRRTLDRLHVRAYTGADYLDRWTTLFKSNVLEAPPTAVSSTQPATVALVSEMKEKRLSQRALAAGIKKDYSFLSKVLKGQKPWPEGLLEKAQAWVAGQVRPTTLVPTLSGEKAKGDTTLIGTALALLGRGWSAVPQRPGAKKPLVRWKPFQERRPTEEEWTGWSKKWPDAGLALILGPVGGVLVVDVDGPEAHAALTARLGGEPQAPKALSGSGEPYRYHLFFRCPDVPTKAKQTPWHPNLEFRGKGGIVVIPPSLHESGNRYAWAEGRSPDDLDLPDVPTQILEALKPVPATKPLFMPSIRRKLSVTGIDASPRTLEFLSGKYSEGPRWNDKLFNAACDLCGRGLPQEEAEPLLLAGAAPWSKGEEELARRTIASAYTQPREPGRL